MIRYTKLLFGGISLRHIKWPKLKSAVGRYRTTGMVVRLTHRKKADTAYNMPALPDDYDLTGFAASLRRGKKLVAAFRAYALTGYATTFSKKPPVWSSAPTTSINEGTAGSYTLPVSVPSGGSPTITVTWHSSSVPSTKPDWITINNGTAPSLSFSGTQTATDDVTSMVLTATANGQSVNSGAGSIAVNATDVSWTGTEDDAAVSFTQGVAGQTYDLTQHVTNWDADLYAMEQTAGTDLSLAGVTLSTDGVLTYNGTAGTNIIGGVQVTITNNAEADFLSRISGSSVVWYHDFQTAAEVDQFRWSNGYSSGNDPLAKGADGPRNRWISTDGITGGALEILVGTGTAGQGSHWWRPLNPFSSGHGRATADPAASNTVTKRVWSPTDGGNQTATWQYGWYRNPAQGTGTSDGSEFYLQVRVKMDPRRITGGNAANTIGKFVWFSICQYSLSDGEHVTYSYGDGGNQGNQNYWRLYATNVVGQGYFDPIASPPDIQPGDTNNNVDWYYSGGWDCLLYHLRPGRNGVTSGADATLLEVWAATQADINAGVGYRKIFSKTYGIYAWEAGGGPQALLLSGYNNGASFPQQFYHRYAQVIFSKAFIPCPAPGC